MDEDKDAYWDEFVRLVGEEEAEAHREEYLRLADQTVAS
jgi:hypothetical protein